MKSDAIQIVFLISIPRSGSTLLQAILGSHSEILTSSEPWVALAPLSNSRIGSGEFDFNARLWQKTTNAFYQEKGISEQFIRSQLRNYLNSIYSKALEGSGKGIFLDKTPRYYEILPELYNTFPDAKFVVLHRNPMWIMRSILRTWVKTDIEKLLDYHRDLLIAPSRINDFESNRYPNVFSLKYEDILSDPNTLIEQVCKFIGVEFEPAMMNYDASQDWAFGDKIHLDHSTVATTGEAKKATDGLNRQQQEFLAYFISNFAEERCSCFGYSHSQMQAEVAEIEPSVKTIDAWNLVMNAKPYSSYLESKKDLQKQLELLDRKRGLGPACARLLRKVAKYMET